MSRANGRAQRFRVVSIAGSAAGFLGGLACSAAMVLAALGVIGASAAAGASSVRGMAGMDRAHSGDDASVFRFLLDHGPTILVVSTVLLTLALGLRRRGSALTAAIVGGVMYWGMYVQARVPVMYAAIAIGLVAWIALILAPVRFPSPRERP